MTLFVYEIYALPPNDYNPVQKPKTIAKLTKGSLLIQQNLNNYEVLFYYSHKKPLIT